VKDEWEAAQVGQVTLVEREHSLIDVAEQVLHGYLDVCGKASVLTALRLLQKLSRSGRLRPRNLTGWRVRWPSVSPPL